MALRRIAAFGIDWMLIIAWAVVIATVSVLLGVGNEVPSNNAGKLAGHGIALVSLSLPVILFFAWRDAMGGSPGKRLLGIGVTATGRQALARNILKFLPWEIAHAGIWWGAERPFLDAPGIFGWVLMIGAQLLALAYVAGLFIGNGRTLYDRIAGTKVTR